MNRVLIHDISHWQGNLSTYWKMFKDKGCKAIIIKATEGLAFYSIFKEYAEQAKAAGFLVGTYHYWRHQIKNLEGSWVTCDPIRQAENYFSWVQKSGIKMDLPPALDVEGGNNPSLVVGPIDTFLRRTESLWGRLPMVYSSPSVLIGRLGNPPWGKYPLWLAHYTTEDKIHVPSPWKNWTIWQFSDKITYDKVNASGAVISRKPIDHNWFNGNLGDLYKFILTTGGSLPASPSTPAPAPTPSVDPAPQPETAPGAAIDIADLKKRVNSAIDDWAKSL